MAANYYLIGCYFLLDVRLFRSISYLK